MLSSLYKIYIILLIFFYYTLYSFSFSLPVWHGTSVDRTTYVLMLLIIKFKLIVVSWNCVSR